MYATSVQHEYQRAEIGGAALMRARGDTQTLDLLSWQAPEVVRNLPAELVRAESLRGRIARSVALVLKESTMSRDDIARRMSDFLGEEVSKAMLDAYASQAREEHTISAIRLVALAHATDDIGALQILIDPLDHAVVPNRYVCAIEAEIKSERAAELERAADEMRQEASAARRQWRARRG
jgi:hypothetical protein